MQRDIKHIWFFDAAPELVWEHLTRSELIAQWLMQNDFQPVVGHNFTFMTRPMKAFGFDGIVHCRVMEVVPMKKLVYTWKGGNNGKISLDSVVTWTLTPKDNGTELQLVHAGFKGLKNFMAYVSMNAGWGSKIINRMKDMVNKAKNGAATH